MRSNRFRRDGRSSNVNAGCAGHTGPYALKVPIAPEAEEDAQLEAKQSEQELGVSGLLVLFFLLFLSVLP